MSTYECQSCGAQSHARHTIEHDGYCPGQVFAYWVAVKRDPYTHTGFELGAL